jgi:hypothetical protein
MMHQITRTLASTYVLHPHKLFVQYFRVPEKKSGVKGVKFRWCAQCSSGKEVLENLEWSRKGNKTYCQTSPL